MSRSIETRRLTRFGLISRAAYIGLILIATLTALHLDSSFEDASSRLWRAVHPRLKARDVVDAVRNVALFAGLGVLWVSTAARASLRDVVRVTLFGATISFAVETVQLFSPTRTSSLIDVATNTFGALAGAMLMWVTIRLVKARPTRTRLLGVPFGAIAVPYLGAVLCEVFTPLLRQEHVPDILGSRLVVALSTIPPFSAERIPWLDAVLLFPAGAFLTAFILEEVDRRTISFAQLASTLIGSALIAATELAHGVGGGLIRPEAVAVHIVAFVLGALAGPRLIGGFLRLGDARRRLGVLVSAYSLLLIAWTWRPFRPRLDTAWVSAQFGETHLVPLAALANQVSLFSVGHLGNIFLLFVPLGVILVARASRDVRAENSSMSWELAYGLALPWVLELGHLVLADRTFDVTNSIVEMAGMCIGWSLTVRSREASGRMDRVQDSILFAVQSRNLG